LEINMDLGTMNNAAYILRKRANVAHANVIGMKGRSLQPEK